MLNFNGKAICYEAFTLTHYTPHRERVHLIPGLVYNCASCARQVPAACSDTWWKGRSGRPSGRGSCAYEADPSPSKDTHRKTVLTEFFHMNLG